MNTNNKSIRQHAHHYESGEHEFNTSMFGMWLFLATEILMFGGMIVGYIIFNGIYPEMFAEGASFLDWRLGTLNTVVLLLSSFTMVMGVRSAQTGNNNSCYKYLVVTVLLGAVFMCVKYYEYTHKFHLGLYPGELFSYEGAQASNLALYFSFYFCLTGMHGLHVLLGMIYISWMAFKAKRGDFSPEYYTPVEGVGLFWHLIDLIWIYLFPILYLI